MGSCEDHDDRGDHEHEHDHDHDHDHHDHAHEPCHNNSNNNPNNNNNNNNNMVMSEEEQERRHVLKRLQCAALLCVFFFLIEVVGGWLAGSLAVLSDAAHLFSDLASFLVAIFANYLASLPSTSQHTYGLKRSESLAALFSMISLALVCVWLGWEAVRRLYIMIVVPDLAEELYNVDGKLMSGIAGIGVLVNLALAYVLGGEHHGHGHGHSHAHHDHHSHHDHDHDHDSDDDDDDESDHHNHHHHQHQHDKSGGDEEQGGGSCGQNEHSHDHKHDTKETAAPAAHDERTSLLQHQQPPSASSSFSSNPSSSYTPEHANEVLPPPSPHHDHHHTKSTNTKEQPASQTKKKKKAKKPRNVNLQAAYLHVLGDLAQSVAVLIAGVIIYIQPSWYMVDPICTLGFCILVFSSTLGVVRSSIAVLLEEVPPQISWKAIYHDLTQIPNVSGVHDLHIWCISDGVPCLSLHAFCDNGDCPSALQQITAVCQKHGIAHVTAQVQPRTIPSITSTTNTTTTSSGTGGTGTGTAGAMSAATISATCITCDRKIAHN